VDVLLDPKSPLGDDGVDETGVPGVESGLECTPSTTSATSDVSCLDSTSISGESILRPPRPRSPRLDTAGKEGSSPPEISASLVPPVGV